MTDNRLTIFEQLLKEIQKRKEQDTPFVVGISGIDTSGKTRFAESLQEFLNSMRLRTQLIKLDDFHNARNIRYSGNDEPENYYNRSFDLETIVEKLLKPMRQKAGYSVRLTLLDLFTDKYEIEKEFSFDKDTIVIFEGVFLYRMEFSPYIDYKVFLDMTFEESKKRAKGRDVPIYGEQVLVKYDTKYLPAQRKYLNEFPPARTVDMVIDNTDWNSPKVRLMRR